MKAVLHKMIKHLESAPVESHSFSRLAYTTLYGKHIDATFHVGKVSPSTVDGQATSNHAWLESLGYIIDFRAINIVSSNAPYGVFTHKEALEKGFIYEGEVKPISPLDDHVITFLTATTPTLID